MNKVEKVLSCVQYPTIFLEHKWPNYIGPFMAKTKDQGLFIAKHMNQFLFICLLYIIAKMTEGNALVNPNIPVSLLTIDDLDKIYKELGINRILSKEINKIIKIHPPSVFEIFEEIRNLSAKDKLWFVRNVLNLEIPHKTKHDVLKEIV